jgi:DNA-binding NarL/FixJ family response regulator
VSALRCLVVDDHPVVRQGIRALLERELDGVEVSTADTPDAAIAEASGRSPDVVVIDLRRVSGDVQDTVSSLQDRLGSPIVVFTADGGPRMLAEALKAGVKGYVRKDSPPEDLIRAIQAARSGEFYVDPALSSSLLLEEPSAPSRPASARSPDARRRDAYGRGGQPARPLYRDGAHPHEAHPRQASGGHAHAGGCHRHPQRAYRVVPGS